MHYLLPSLVLFLVALFFAVILVFLSKKLEVQGDARVDEVNSLLMKANCGGCGYAGCEAFAAALVQGKAKVDDCPSTCAENKKKIAKILGTKTTAVETVAVVCCRGGSFCTDKFEYLGNSDCNSESLLAGGGKACAVGCLGHGDCIKACKPHAMLMSKDGFAEIQREKCTSCGACMKACPKKIIRRIPKTARVYIACTNECKGRIVKEICKRGCIGCALCQRACKYGAISMEKNLAVIDYKKCKSCGNCVLKCPVGCININ